VGADVPHHVARSKKPFQQRELACGPSARRVPASSADQTPPPTAIAAGKHGYAEIEQERIRELANE